MLSACGMLIIAAHIGGLPLGRGTTRATSAASNTLHVPAPTLARNWQNATPNPHFGSIRVQTCSSLNWRGRCWLVSISCIIPLTCVYRAEKMKRIHRLSAVAAAFLAVWISVLRSDVLDNTQWLTVLWVSICCEWSLGLLSRPSALGRFFPKCGALSGGSMRQCTI